MSAEPAQTEFDSEAKAAARRARQIEILDELAGVGRELALAVAEHTRKRLVMAETHWDINLPRDQGAAFTKVVQCVRRTIALSVHLSETGNIQGSAAPAGLFAPPQRPMNLHPTMPASSPEAPDGRPAAIEASERFESVAGDVGRLLDDPERFIDRPLGPPDGHIAKLCHDLGLDLGRIAKENETWVIKADPADPDSVDTPLRGWGPPLPEEDADNPGPKPGPWPPSFPRPWADPPRPDG